MLMIPALKQKPSLSQLNLLSRALALPTIFMCLILQNYPHLNSCRSCFVLTNKKNKKLIAALLSFPFPFGIVGLHRIYLGTSPHVPIVYIGTLGGGFGLIPLIDFFVILFTKDIEQFISNKKVFMWIN
jgi:TM2 domain-containing membrane protein YozV